MLYLSYSRKNKYSNTNWKQLWVVTKQVTGLGERKKDFYINLDLF